MATNHGVGGSNPSSPTTGPKGKYLSLWGSNDGDSGPKVKRGVDLLSKWNGFSFYFVNGAIITHSIPRSSYFFVLRSVNLPQPGLGRIVEQVQVLVAYLPRH